MAQWLRRNLACISKLPFFFVRIQGISIWSVSITWSLDFFESMWKQFFRSSKKGNFTKLNRVFSFSFASFLMHFKERYIDFKGVTPKRINWTILSYDSKASAPFGFWLILLFWRYFSYCVYENVYSERKSCKLAIKKLVPRLRYNQKTLATFWALWPNFFKTRVNYWLTHLLVNRNICHSAHNVLYITFFKKWNKRLKESRYPGFYC